MFGARVTGKLSNQ